MHNSIVNALRISEKYHLGLSYTIRFIYEHEGKSGLVTRLKSLKTWFIQVLAGNKNFSVPGWRSKIVYNHRYPCFRGLDRAIKRFNELISLCDTNNITRFLTVLNVYKTFKDISEKDVEKVIKTHVLSEPKKPKRPIHREFMTRFVNTIRHHVDYKFNPESLKECSYHFTTSKICYNIHDYVSTGSFTDYVYLKGLDNQDIQRYIEDPNPKCVVKAIPDKGRKVRFVAISTPIDYSIGDEIAKYIRQLSENHPCDCTMDQERGRLWTLRQQQMKKKLFSVDLQNASWRIPVSFQRTLLQEVGVPDKLIKLLTPSIYYKDELIPKYNGQPMGTPLSFAVFSLTLVYLLDSLCFKLCINPSETYRCLGDDIIITNELLYLEFCYWCRCYNVPLSEKTFVSRSIAEFAGTLFYFGHDITPYNYTYYSSPGSFNARYRSMPLIKRCYKIFGKYVWYFCKPNMRAINNSRKSGTEASRYLVHGSFYVGTKSYRDIFAAMHHIPTDLGGCKGPIPPSCMCSNDFAVKLAVSILKSFISKEIPLCKMRLRLSAKDLTFHPRNVLGIQQAYVLASSAEDFNQRIASLYEKSKSVLRHIASVSKFQTFYKFYRIGALKINEYTQSFITHNGASISTAEHNISEYVNIFPKDIKTLNTKGVYVYSPEFSAKQHRLKTPFSLDTVCYNPKISIESARLALPILGDMAVDRYLDIAIQIHGIENKHVRDMIPFKF